MHQGSRSVTLTVPADEVWGLLVAPGLRNWYYRLTPRGEFVPGGHIEWLDGRGEVLEESDVVEVEAPRRLVLRGRFKFAPRFAEAEPQTVTWVVAGDDSGSTVSFSWTADRPAHRLFESDGQGIVQSLRLAADPVARAEIERLPKIGEVVVRDVTPERISDYHRFFDEEAFRDYPVWQDCYCIETMIEGGNDEERTAQENRRDMTSLIGQGRVTALLAFVDGKPVGWCNYGETTSLAGVAKRFKLEAADHEGVGSIGCFVIAAPYRGHGVATALLETAIDRLRAKGLRAVEAYPAKTEGSDQGNYRGPLDMYRRAGFDTHRELERHLVVRKDLA
jgi:GNAT superfamily N-acetyltransferase/uncharacterized protein YndB with AHSA1/START domain